MPQIYSRSANTLSNVSLLAALRAKLDQTSGRQYWQCLESLWDTPEFKEFLDRELPQNAFEWLDPVGRRNILKLMGARDFQLPAAQV